MTGLLIIDGSVDVSQFWPGGKSDGDTVKFAITQPQTALRFRSSRGATPCSFRPGTRGKDFASSRASRAGDQPTLELGCQVDALQFITAVNQPQEVVDKYGRFIGEIIFNRGAADEWNICDWMVQQGWAFPAFYNSMSVAEITRLQTAAKSAQQAKRGIWHYLSNTIGPLDWNMVFRNHGPIDAAKDRGPVVFPKMFRRLCDYSERKKNGTVKGNFASYVAGLKPPDFCYRTADFLKAGGQPAKSRKKKLAQFVTASSKYLAGPGDLVFEEAASTIVDQNNKKINSW